MSVVRPFFLRRRLAGLLAFFAVFVALTGRVPAAESTEESIALYADAANFQTGGALELAIDSWKKFLDRYPDDDLASKAAHYLGVCYMQRENPDYVAATKAFATALEDKSYELREESLANQGWCYYASAGDGPQRDPSRLRSTIATFELLRKESPGSDYIDRAYFYSGEAHYGLGERESAIKMYDKFLALPDSDKSPLRCDAIYARGIALEELKRTDDAVGAYNQLLSACADSQLAIDVHLRLGDLKITQRDFASASNFFQAAIDGADNESDKSYAIFRQAYALVQAGKPNEAALRYDRLQKEFPNSPYAANATLASAQSLYRGGKTNEAAERFEKVLTQNNPVASTEAAHWLARIRLAAGDAKAAAEVARRQLPGAEGDFAIDLRVDLAEALSMSRDTMAESIRVAEQAYRDAPDDPLAPRALYNAAFSALQINEFDKALSLSLEFLRQFSSDQLAADVQFIVAESQLLSGKSADAVGSYRKLLSVASKQSVQRPLWVLRAATAMNAAKSYDDTIAMLKEEYAGIEDDTQKAEAQFLVGQAHLMSGRAADAAVSFGRCDSLAPNWRRVSEAKLLQGTAYLAAQKRDEAKAVWKSLVAEEGSGRMMDQARYKLAQLSSDAGSHRDAIGYYDEIISADRDAGLIPYALYGRGWSHMQTGNHQAALQSLDRILTEFPQHGVADDAQLARGISHRTLGHRDDARKDLESYLKLDPKGTNLGHTLYELALIDQKESQPAEAASRLTRLIREVPEYPGMDKVLYELGWSLREAGDAQAAVKQFKQLLDQYPDAALAGEAAYFVGQQYYGAKDWDEASKYFRIASAKATDDGMSEKSLYRLGWSLFKQAKLTDAEKAFAEQAEKHPVGALAVDAMMMVGECDFKAGAFEKALASYSKARERIRATNDNAQTVRDPSERQVRELILLHGGQSAAQLKRWDEAIGWYNELKERFSATAYLPQVFYETGFAYQQKNDQGEAFKYYTQVADRYRNEVAARARFMMGEIHFGKKQFDKAIPEFQRVMFGFGAEKAPADIKNWQAKSGFEAARCSELLMQTARTEEAKRKSLGFATQFYQYVVEKHPAHELAKKSAERLEALPRP